MCMKKEYKPLDKFFGLAEDVGSQAILNQTAGPMTAPIRKFGLCSGVGLRGAADGAGNCDGGLQCSAKKKALTL